jgi:anaerobic ribonucleoside-triphosphate reductase activating protein
MKTEMCPPRVGGVQPLTMIDFPGKIASVLFLQGCNFRCPFCHNPSLVREGMSNDAGSWSDIVAFLEQRRGFLEGVIFSGGEPTLQPSLIEAAAQIKAMGFQVGLHTNGSRPTVLETLLERDLVSFVALDIKAPWKKYDQIVRLPGQAFAVQRSLRLLAVGIWVNSPNPFSMRDAVWGVAPPPETRIVSLDPLPCGSPQASVSGGPLLAPGRNPTEPSPDGAAGSANILLADSPCAVGFSERFSLLRQELLPHIGIP